MAVPAYACSYDMQLIADSPTSDLPATAMLSMAIHMSIPVDIPIANSYGYSYGCPYGYSYGMQLLAGSTTSEVPAIPMASPIATPMPVLHTTEGGNDSL